MTTERTVETVGLLSLSAERRVDDVCNRFEKALQAGQAVSIKDFLGAVEGAERSALTQELLRLEVEYRLRKGERPSASEYRERFPEHASLVGYWSSAGQAVRAAAPWPQLADYEIVAELGRGGMGVVYHARQKSLNRSVALKMIRGDAWGDAGAIARFQAEARTIARLRHPQIVGVHEVGAHNGAPFFTLEYIDGGNLHQRLKGPPLSDKEAAELVVLLARALHHAHGAGIVHRDLKPANILLTTDGMPKVADFGLAKILGEGGATISGMVVGTASYMSPEAAAGKVKEVGPVSDVYSLGAILYELLTGQPPFTGDSLLEVLRCVEQEIPQLPRVHNPRVDRSLEAICMKCLEKAPQDRYPSAEALADDLSAYLRGESVAAEQGTARRLVGAVLRESRYTEVMTRWSMIWMALAVNALVVCILQLALIYAEVSDFWPFVSLWLAKTIADFVTVWFFRWRIHLSVLPVERQLAQVWVFFWFAHFLMVWSYQATGGPVRLFIPMATLEIAVVLFTMAAILGGSFYLYAALSIVDAVLDLLWFGAGQVFGIVVIVPLFFWLGWKHLPRNRR
jgi:serine/threonine-protein kinase